MFRLTTPFYAPDDGSGVGGGNSGGTAAPGSPSATTPQGTAAPGSGAPSIVDLTPDSLVRVPGQSNPVKWGDYSRTRIDQSEYTKKTQALAAERKAYEAEKAQATQALLEHARQLAAARQSGQNPPKDPLADIRSQAFLDGNTAAKLVESIQQHGIAPIVQGMQQRDKALQLMYKQIEKMAGVIDRLEAQNGQSGIKSKVEAVRAQLGLPSDPAVDDLLQDLYASHEGDNWDEEFPTVAKTRIEGIRKALRDSEKQAADKAKQKIARGQVFGNGVTTKPGGHKSAAEWTKIFGDSLGIPD